MNGFEFVAAQAVEDAVELLADGGGSARIIAGGTDILGELKEGVISPSMLVSVANIPALKGVTVDAEGVRIGAATTLADIEAHPHINSDYAALTQAAASVATPQIRNVGTLGGNLCQRPRCWYYRSPLFDCRKKGGEQCFAHDGSNKFHAIFGGAVCPAVHPSDTAVALLALGADALIASASGERILPIARFFAPPEADVRYENALRAGEALTAVRIPKRAAGLRSVYLKAKERQAMDFALASVALALDVSGGRIGGARIALGGVAPVPHMAREAASALDGRRVSDVDADRIGRIAVQDAKPLSDNGYKVRLAAGLVARAVRTLLEPRDPGTAW